MHGQQNVKKLSVDIFSKWQNLASADTKKKEDKCCKIRNTGGSMCGMDSQLSAGCVWQ